MIVDALSQIRHGPAPSTGMESPSSQRRYQQMDDSIDSGYLPSPDVLSVRTKKSSTSSTGQTSLTDSVSSRQGRRHSNHLFSSGRFRDQSYMRTAGMKKSQSRGQLSITSETSAEAADDVPHTAIPEQSPPLLEAEYPSSYDSTPTIRSAPLLAPHPFQSSLPVPSTASPAEKRASKPLSPAALKRLSAAFQEVLREIEEETEDEIVLPRSPPVARPSQKNEVKEASESEVRRLNHMRDRMLKSNTATPSGRIGCPVLIPHRRNLPRC